ERREQLDLAVTGRQERGAHALIPDQRLLHERQTEGVAVEPIRLCEVPDHDAHVMNPSHHARSLLIEADGGHAGPDPERALAVRLGRDHQPTYPTPAACAMFRRRYSPAALNSRWNSFQGVGGRRATAAFSSTWVVDFIP